MTNRTVNLFAFTVLALLWLALLAALVFNRQLLDSVWQLFRSWPLVLQILVGLLVLPLTAGLWIWETSWPFLLRLVLVLGLAGWTMYMFFPRKTNRQSATSSAES
jgi:hypothetical protein